MINLIFGICMLAFEWPLRPIAGTSIHKSIEFRLLIFPLLALAAIIMYQSTNAAVYYILGEIIYFWAFADGEVRYLRDLYHRAITHSRLRLFVQSLGHYPDDKHLRILHKKKHYSSILHLISPFNNCLHSEAFGLRYPFTNMVMKTTTSNY
jgi:hypothetical protein